MSVPGVFRASVHGFRTVPSRGVVSITIEAPIEQHAEIARIAEHGAWVAVARLTQDAKEEPSPEKPTSSPTQARPAHSQLPTPPAQGGARKGPAQMAGIVCNDPRFWRFLTEKYFGVASAPDAAQAVREICGIASRSELGKDEQATAEWERLRNDYEVWLRVVA